jgi:hypothetical protein
MLFFPNGGNTQEFGALVILNNFTSRKTEPRVIFQMPEQDMRVQ